MARGAGEGDPGPRGGVGTCSAKGGFEPACGLAVSCKTPGFFLPMKALFILLVGAAVLNSSLPGPRERRTERGPVAVTAPAAAAGQF